MKSLITLLFAILLLFNTAVAQTSGDAALARVREQDRISRDAQGRLPELTPAEHSYRAEVYSTNRIFASAREHWQRLIDRFPIDESIPKALMGIGRSYMWERECALAVTFFDEAIKNFPFTKEGRESLAFKGACQVRLGLNEQAVKTYEQYTVMFPTGERAESSHLNIIDALRESRQYDAASNWVDRTRTRFAGSTGATNAQFAKLRMEIYRQNFNGAVLAADLLLTTRSFAGSMTSADEVKLLRAMSLEKMNRRNEAISGYLSVTNSVTSYYGGLADERLAKLNSPRAISVTTTASSLPTAYPIRYRNELLRHAKSRGIDPRFVLAIMKQESSFNTNAKSPAAARGLLQLVFDTAVRYNKQAGYPTIREDDLYRPDVNIAIGCAYIAALMKQFGGLYEAVAASYNGGEDNVVRWMNRTSPKEPAIFAAEVGFSETKNYVFKVMGNYRVYRALYNEDLTRKL